MPVAPHTSCQAQPVVLNLRLCSFTKYHVSLPARSQARQPAPNPVIFPGPSESRPTGLKALQHCCTQASARTKKPHDGLLCVARMVSPLLAPLTATSEMDRTSPRCSERLHDEVAHIAAPHQANKCSEGLHDGVQVARVAAAHRVAQRSEGLDDGVQVACVAAAHRAVQRLRQQARHAPRGPVAAAVMAAAVVAAAVRRACRTRAL